MRGLLAEMDWPKVIGGLAVVAFWIFSTVAGAIAKKKQEEEQRRRREELIRRGELPAELGGPGVSRSGPPVLGAPDPTAPRDVGGPGDAVRTRAEMERRMAEARARREAAAGRENATFKGAPAPGPRMPPPIPSMRDSPTQGPFRGESDSDFRTREDDLELRDDAPDQEMESLRHRQDTQRREQEQLLRNAERKRVEAERIRAASRRVAQQRAAELAAASEEQALAQARAEVIATATGQAKASAEKAQARRQAPRDNGVSALTIRQWATPATLRQQFILTELFSPPVALRPGRVE